MFFARALPAVLLLLVTNVPDAIQQKLHKIPITCDAGDFTAGEYASVTCHFHKDMKDDRRRIKVKRYPLNATNNELAMPFGSGRPTYRWELDEDHFFMSYATTPHHVAAFTSLGGHFFRCLTSSLQAHAASLPVDDIVMLVGDRLGELRIKQTPICETTLRKKLYFSNEQPQTRRRVDTPRRPAHPMGPYQDVYGRLVYPAPYPGEQVMSGATYPQDVYGHYVYPAPYLEEHVMSGATYLQDMRGHYVYPAYYPGEQVMSGATYPQMTAEREEERPREGGDAVRTRRDKKHCVLS